MPYINQPDDEELKKQQEAQASSPTSISGQSAVLSTDAPSNKGGAKGSGSYTNLNQYLDANKENAAQLGSGIATHISNQGNEARTGIQNTEADFQQLADKGTLQGLDRAADESKNIIQQARTGTKDNQINQTQASRFGEIANAEYKGPQDLTGSSLYENTSKQYQKALDTRTNAGNEQGRFSLLKDAYARPTYSQGQQNLDNLLLTGNTQAREAVSNAAVGLGDLESRWAGAQTNAAALAAQRKAATEAARAGAREGLVSNRSARASEVDADLAAKQAQWGSEYDRLNNILSSYGGGDLELSQADINKFGLTGAGQGLYNTLSGTNPASYLDLKAFDANKVVSQDQFAQLAALDQLGTKFGTANLSRFTDPSQAGTLSLENNLDASALGRAATAQDSQFQDLARRTNIEGTASEYAPGQGSMPGGTAPLLTSSMQANLANYLQDAGNSSMTRINDRLDNQAIANFMAQLNSILDSQGYNNRVKVK